MSKHDSQFARGINDQNNYTQAERSMYSNENLRKRLSSRKDFNTNLGFETISRKDSCSTLFMARPARTTSLKTEQQQTL